MTFKQTLIRGFKALDRVTGLRAWLMSDSMQLPGGFDLRGEKELDWGWIASNVPARPGSALDVGCIGSPVSTILLSMGYAVTGVDLRSDPPFILDRFRFVQGDFNALDFPDASFDLAVLCSTVEHIGLAGRYDNPDNQDGDLTAMQKTARLLKPSGVCLLTIPLGKDAVFAPWHRVYGRERLPRLIDRFEIVKSRFYAKEPEKPWRQVDADNAIDYPATAARYALGQYVLSRAR